MAYADIYAGWKADPEGFWMEAAEAIDWVKPPTRALFADTRAALRMVHRCRRSTPAGTPSTAMSRPGAAISWRSSTTARSPIRPSGITYARTADPRGHALPGRCAPRAWKRATASSSTCRWCPRRWRRCWPAPGWARSIRWCSAALPRMNWRCASTTARPRRSSPPPAGIEPGRVVHYKPLLDAAIDMADAQARFLRDLPARTRGGQADRGPRFRLAHVPVSAWNRPNACRSRAIIRPISSTPPAPPARPRAWCAPPPGHLVALNWTMKGDLQHRRGRCVLGGLGRGLGRRPQLYLLRAADRRRTTIVFEGKPVGTPDAGTFWRVIAEHKVKSLLHRPDRPARDQARRPRRRADRRLQPAPVCRRCILAGERADPDTDQMGAAPSGRAGDRPLVADRNRLCHRRQPAGDRGAAGQDRLALGADAGL